MFRDRRILVVAPHADDEVLGCGGTILKAVAQGASVHLLIVSVGDLVRVGDGGELRTGSERVEEVERVAAFLGAASWEVAFHDSESHMRLDAMPRRDLVAVLERSQEIARRVVCSEVA